MLKHYPFYGIRVRTAWWGLGAIISASTSQLLKITTVPYLDWWSYWYTHEQSPRVNIYEWFFRQKKDKVEHVYNEWDRDVFNINTPRSVVLVKKARQRWREIIGRTPDRQGCLHAALALHNRIAVPMLGVHYRGTDKKAEVAMPPIEEVIEKIRSNQISRQLPHVLICTDDQNFLTRCLNDLSGVCYFENHLRAAGLQGLHTIAGSVRQCLEVMTEIRALGFCSHLLLGRSCVADAALFLSDDRLISWEYYN